MHRGRRTWLALRLVVLSSSLVTTSLAVPPQESATPAPPNHATSSRSQPGATGSTLARLSQKLAALPLGEASLVVFAPLRIQGSKQLNPEALLAFQRSLVDVVGSGAPLGRKRLTQTLSLEEARTEARRRKLALLYLEPSLRNGVLNLDVTFTQWPSSFWQRALVPQGTVTHHVQFQEAADETLRRLLPPPKGLLTETLKFTNPVQSPVALACGDLDHDGGSELLIVGRHQVAVGRFQGRKFIKEASLPWSSLSPVAAAPLRAPLAAARITPEGALVGLSDRKNLVLLNSRLEKVREAPGAYPVNASQCVAFGATGLRQGEFSCFTESHKPSSARADEYDIVATGRVTESSGVVSRLRSHLTQSGITSTTIESGALTGLSIDTLGLGSALAWADLDGDGTLELLASGDGASGTEDEIHLLRLEGKELKPLKELKTAEVHAFAVCPFSGENPIPVVAAIGRELWLLR